MRPEDRPKAIGLVVGVIVVFTLVTLRVKSAMGGDFVPPPENPKVQVAGTGSTSGATGTTPVPVASTVPTPGIGAGALPKKDVPIKLNQVVAPPAKDPFQPHKGKGEKSDELAIADARARRKLAMEDSTSNDQTDQTAPTTPMQGTLPKPERSPGTSLKPANPDGLAVENDQPKSDYLQLSGIVGGGRSAPIVVIKCGGKDYVVSAGDTFGDGFRLISATDTMVVITQGMVHHTLKFGVPMD